MDKTSKRVGYILLGLLFTGLLYMLFIGPFSLSTIYIYFGASGRIAPYANQFYVTANILSYATLVGSFGFFFSLLIFTERPFPSEVDMKRLNIIFYTLIMSAILTLMWTSVVRTPWLIALIIFKVTAIVLLHFHKRNWQEKYELGELIDLMNRIEMAKID